MYDDINKAWDKKTGNSAEINLMVYHLLQSAGVEAYPMVLSTAENGDLIPDFPNFYQLNYVVTYIPIDSTRYYILDATSKYNQYNQIPLTTLNRHGLLIDKDKKVHRLMLLANTQPVDKITYVNAEVTADGMINGFAQLSSYSYNKMVNLMAKNALDEKTYRDLLIEPDTKMQITSIKTDNAEVDSLPLLQTVDFSYKGNADDKYIYVVPNLFTQMRENPFKSEKRYSDIDFHYLNKQVITGRYKIPQGYKADVLPEKMILKMDDGSIVCSRLAGEIDGLIVIRFNISFLRSVFTIAEYPYVRNFYKRMVDMLNEPIVLKKI